jgi:transforming growth factor-beta-induced protein
MGSSVSLNTLAGESIIVQKTMAGAVLVNGAAVVLPDRLANNGIMHLINQVLEPPNLTSTPTQSPIDIPAGDRVDDTIATFSILSTLGSLLTTSGLIDDLSTFGPFAVFAPSNTAFNNLPAGRLTKYRQPQYIQHLRSYLNFHVYVGDLPTSSTALTMRNGDDVALQVTGSAVSIQNNIVQATTSSANGQVLLISTVLTPPFFSESLASILSEEYSILFELVTLAGMTPSLISFDADLTIFAPTDAAFEALGDQLEDLKQPSNLGQLTTILNNHIISTVIPRANIPMGTTTLATVAGSSRTIVRNAAIFVDDVPVILPDQLAANGIVHGLNAVLLTPMAVLVVNTGEFEPNGLESGAVTYQWQYWVATTLGLWATVTLFV